MRLLLVGILLLMAITTAFLVNALEFSGDGVHIVSKGDIVTIDNGWQIEILGIFMAHNGEQINFRVYDPEGNSYPEEPYLNTLQKIEGKQKYGTDEILKVEFEILEVSGSTSSTGSPFVTEYENAKINAASIDEKLPGVVGGEDEEDFEDIDKELTYKDGVKISMNAGDEKELANGYTLKFDSFKRFGPSFSIYDGGNLIDEGIQVGKGVGFFGGSYIHLDDFDDTSINLNIIDGSEILFGTGWNLFSIPVEDGDGFGTVLESTCNEATVWRWDVESEDYEAVGKLEEGPINEIGVPLVLCAPLLFSIRQ